jgi:prevent-host-death family protein
MLHTNFTNIRDIQRNYREVAREVNTTNMPMIVMSKNEPQFAIVSLQTLEQLEQKGGNNSLQGLVKIAQWVKEHDVAIPADLGEKHNEYTWDA